jgi:TPR repeat protein
LTVDPNQAFKQAVEFYHANNFASAAKSATYPAELGHPGAQCMLGTLYETGQGVSKSLDDALKWYTKSAEQGFPPAAMKLGSLYSDLFSTRQDLVEACAWYGVAAAKGEKAADAFRRSIEHKLTPEQLTKAKERTEAILGSGTK